MKKHFADYRFRNRAMAKAHQMSLEQLADYLKKSQAIGIAGLSLSQIKIASHEVAAEKAVLEGRATHYFIETESLAQILPTLVKQWEEGFLEAIADLDRGGTGIIHTTGKDSRAILFSFCPGGTKWNDQLLVSDGHEAHVWLTEPRERFIANGYDPAALDLVFGVALYLHCFPAALRDGFPDFAKHPSHFNGASCALISAVPQIIDREGPVPHFRHGHFRMLRSPRFTKKRFHVVFVKEAFVKGKVKTVVEV